MKRAFSFIVLYISTLLLLSVFFPVMLLLYPETPVAMTYVDSFECIADIFLYSFFYLLPLTSIFSLLSVVFAVIKHGYSSVLDFLVYVFLCCIVWLLIVPLCFLYDPASGISFFITDLRVSPVASFFKGGFLHIAVRGNEDVYVMPPSVIISFFSKLAFANSLLRTAVNDGRFAYLITASAGLAFSSLYGFYSFSGWKLMNAALVIVLFAAISMLNIYMYMPELSPAVRTKWFPLVANSAIAFLFCVFLLVRVIVRARSGAEE